MPEPSPAPVGVDSNTGEIAKPTTRLDSVLKDHRGGGLHNEASEKLAALVADCRALKKKGSLTITVHVEPDKTDDTQVIVRDVLTVKAPKAPTQPSRFFSDAAGNLSRRDPRQPELPLQAVKS